MNSTKNFSDLDDFTKLDIFEYLSAGDLKNCSQVCSEWHDLIGQSPAVMGKFKLEIDVRQYRDDDDAKVDEKMKSYENCKLHFQHLYNDGEDFVDATGLRRIQVITMFSEHLKTVELNKTRFSCEGMLFNFLNALKNLEKIFFCNVDYEKPSDDKKVPIDAIVAPAPNLNLKKLILISTSKAITESLAKAKVQSSQIMVSFLHVQYNGGTDYTHVVNLLNCQNKLVDLALKTYQLEQQREVYQQLIANIKYQEHLTSLTVEFEAIVENDKEVPSTKKHFDHFIRYISKMKSLEELEINSFNLPVPQRVFTTIHRELKLKKLILDVANLPESFVLNSAVISPNPHLKSFCSPTLMSMKKLPPAFVNRFFEMYPEIENLWFSGNLRQNIRAASDHLKKLKHLTVGIIEKDFPAHPIPTLQTFKAFRTDSIVGLQKFLDANPSIASLNLNFARTVFQTRTVPMLTRKLINLDHLQLSGFSNLNYNYEMCEGLSLHCPKLRTVKIQKMYAPEGESESDSEPPLVLPKIKEHPKVKLIVTNQKWSPPKESKWEDDEDFDMVCSMIDVRDDAAVFYDDDYGSLTDSEEEEESDVAQAFRRFGLVPRFDRLTRQEDSYGPGVGWPGNGSNYFRDYNDWINRQEDWDYEDWQDYKEMFMGSDSD